jgi:two-component system chemotaxis response regulator CheB
MRKLIPQIIERDTSIQVVGTAMDGEFALKKIEELRPDVVTLDLEMPRMDGMETLRAITRAKRLPVIIVSAHSTSGASSTFKALALGAFDFIAKPNGAAQAQMNDIAAELISKIKVAAKTEMPQVKRTLEVSPEPMRVAKPAARGRRAPSVVIAIGISTGGPNALQYVLSKIPPEFDGAIAVVQHMPEGFTDMFARRLNEISALDVKEAQSGDVLYAGRVLVCPGNRHMRVKRMPMGDIVVLSDEERVNGHRPSCDVLFRSMAAEFGSDGVGVIMTGMGDDGAEGIGEMRHAGATTIAQDEASCVVYGMPKTAIERGYATRVVSLENMANTFMAQCHRAAAR